MRKISIYETVLCDLTIYWMVTYSFVVVMYMPAYKLLGTEHFITDGGERGGFGDTCPLLRIVRRPQYDTLYISIFLWIIVT